MSLTGHRVTYVDKSVIGERHLAVVISRKPKSMVIRGVLHAEWRLLISLCSQDILAMLGQVTGSVTLNKPAVPVEVEGTGCWSACINFRGIQGLAVSILVTIAEPRCPTGRHPVTPATAVSSQVA